MELNDLNDSSQQQFFEQNKELQYAGEAYQQ